jgi:hypothetical protein
MGQNALSSTAYTQLLCEFSTTHVNSWMLRKLKFCCFVVPLTKSWGGFTRPVSYANSVISHTLDLSNEDCPIEIVAAEFGLTLPVRRELMCAGDVNPWASRGTSLHHTPHVKSSLKPSNIIHLHQKHSCVGSSCLRVGVLGMARWDCRERLLWDSSGGYVTWRTVYCCNTPHALAALINTGRLSTYNVLLHQGLRIAQRQTACACSRLRVTSSCLTLCYCPTECHFRLRD